jgi:hypothetical protein
MTSILLQVLFYVFSKSSKQKKCAIQVFFISNRPCVQRSSVIMKFTCKKRTVLTWLSVCLEKQPFLKMLMVYKNRIVWKTLFDVEWISVFRY